MNKEWLKLHVTVFLTRLFLSVIFAAMSALLAWTAIMGLYYALYFVFLYTSAFALLMTFFVFAVIVYMVLGYKGGN